MTIEANARTWDSGAAGKFLDHRNEPANTKLQTRFQALRKTNLVFCCECSSVVPRFAKQQRFCCSNCRVKFFRRKAETNRHKTTSKNNYKGWQAEYRHNRFASQITIDEFIDGRRRHKWSGR